MNAIGQSNFLQALGWAVLNSLWQMALLWIIYLLVVAVCRPLSSSRKSSLATMLLLLGFGWFLFTFFSIFSDSAANGGVVAASGFLEISGNEELNHWLSTMLPVASLAYLILLILPLLHFGRNYRYVQLIRQNGLQKINVEWRMFVKRVAAQMGIRKPVRIWISELVNSPVTIGYLKPVILVPLAAINHLSTQQLEAVLLHELSHIRRFDYLINLVLNFIRAILYFNPFVKAFVRTVEREREKSCDEIVMQFQYDPHGYASALLMLEKVSAKMVPLAVPATGKKNELLKRIEIILGVHKGPVVSFNRLAGLFAGLLCFIGLNAILILTKPGEQKQSSNGPIAGFSSPFYFFTSEERTPTIKSPVAPASTEIGATAIVNHAPKKENLKKENIVEAKKPGLANYVSIPDYPSPYVYVRYSPVAIAAPPALKGYQVEKIKSTLESTKKVLEESQWRAAEKNMADAFTQSEKDQLKDVYLKKAPQLDMKKYEKKLSMVYDQVDWDRINAQLDNAITHIKLDSLQKVYANMAIELNMLQQELAKNDLKGIPDSDISKEMVDQRVKDVQGLLNRVNAVRTKKIVHL